MAQQNEDPAGMNRGATTNNAAHDNDNHTHSNGHGSAQDRGWADYNSTSASHRPDIEAIEVQSGIVDVFHVKLRNAGTVAVEAGQLADFRRFNQACIAQLWCAFDPPPSAMCSSARLLNWDAWACRFSCSRKPSVHSRRSPR